MYTGDLNRLMPAAGDQTICTLSTGMMKMRFAQQGEERHTEERVDQDLRCCVEHDAEVYRSRADGVVYLQPNAENEDAA